MSHILYGQIFKTRKGAQNAAARWNEPGDIECIIDAAQLPDGRWAVRFTHPVVERADGVKVTTCCKAVVR